MTTRLCFVQHEEHDPAGHLGEHAHALGLEIEVVRLDRGQGLPDPSDVDVLVPLGSFASAADDTVPWLADELDLLRRADAHDVAILGVCFGGQALARALGGTVAPLQTPEIGWLELDTDDPTLIASGPWVVWHNDGFEPPPTAREIARTPRSGHAFAVRRHLGIQFRPEVTPDLLDAWVDGSPDMLAAAGVSAGQVIGPARAAGPRAEERAGRLLRAFLAHAGVPAPASAT
ncbi:type 1 glutamine amidotransferase [Egibacter rhizosphaerae]|uniref:Type 1 glutamine amidotransferase n=1 Tax=Egibacter rhizosphaerae TaxID=1670831 RepID=A0A411YEZ7_9ACTN|nr:type 1 glutamine amidotransferase [Egibacter rhizosphaerae]QBI19769.1 type 1 glutamine amidotransferase [Egibacter rhizosphaerae]